VSEEAKLWEKSGGLGAEGWERRAESGELGAESWERRAGGWELRIFWLIESREKERKPNFRF
jgi:hypothetical protein